MNVDFTVSLITGEKEEQIERRRLPAERMDSSSGPRNEIAKKIADENFKSCGRVAEN